MIKFKIGLIAIVFTGLLFSSCNRHIAQHKEVTQYYYTCPMHPDDIYFQPGKCPKCGMTLEAWDMKNMPKKSNSSHSGRSDSGGHSGGCH